MSHKTTVTDSAYYYDGSFQGLLCCIFESYARREIPSAVFSPEYGQTTLFPMTEIETVPAHAARVVAGLDRLGYGISERLSEGFLCTDEGKDLALLRFARLCFTQGPGAMQMLGNRDAATAFQLQRAVHNEACHLIELLRFEERDGMLGAVVHPKHYVLPLLRPHFCSRLPDENFLIFDANHHIALVRQGNRVQYLGMERFENSPSEEELNWQALWKGFFKALTIEERRNEKLQMSHVYKRFWQDMPEMRPDYRPMGQK